MAGLGEGAAARAPVQKGPDEVQRQVGGDEVGGRSLVGEQALAPLTARAHCARGAVGAGPPCSKHSHRLTVIVAAVCHITFKIGNLNRRRLRRSRTSAPLPLCEYVGRVVAVWLTAKTDFRLAG